MGHTILLQWSISPPPANLTDVIITRLLEHYGLAQPHRTTINFRTYRATFPSTLPNESPNTRLLTTITYSQPIPLIRDATPPSQPRDDTTYLFLEDRTPLASSSKASAPATAPTPVIQDVKPEQSVSVVDPTISEFIDVNTPAPVDTGLDVEGFEIVEPPPLDTAEGRGAISGGGEQTLNRIESPLSSIAKGKRGTYRMLAVKPSSAVLPLLQNLLSPLVMGLTKSARAAASTTAQTSTPTPLPGTPLLITSLTFPSISAPHPPIKITLHNLASPAATTIFIEAEYIGAPNPIMATTVLREFLSGCIPDGIGGDKRFHEWDAGDDDEGWEGIERTKRATMLLARCLREATYI